MKISYVLIITVILTGMVTATAIWNNGYYIDSQGLWIVPSINKVPSLLIYNGMTEADAVKALKREPLHTRTGPGGDKILSYNDILKEPSGFDLYTRKGRIVAICIYTQNIPDKNGIHTGTDRSMLIEKYGTSCKKEIISGHGSGITYEEKMGNIFFRLNSSDKIEEIIIYLKGQW